MNREPIKENEQKPENTLVWTLPREIKCDYCQDSFIYFICFIYASSYPINKHALLWMSTIDTISHCSKWNDHIRFTRCPF